MGIEIERFNNEKVLSKHMTIKTAPKYSLSEIRNFIGRSLDNFVEEHREELIEVLDRGDYDEVPIIDSYESFYFERLAPQVEDRMQKSGYSAKQIKEMIGYGDALFYRSILPSVRYKCRERKHAA